MTTLTSRELELRARWQPRRAVESLRARQGLYRLCDADHVQRVCSDCGTELGPSARRCVALAAGESRRCLAPARYGKGCVSHPQTEGIDQPGDLPDKATHAWRPPRDQEEEEDQMAVTVDRPERGPTPLRGEPISREVLEARWTMATIAPWRAGSWTRLGYRLYKEIVELVCVAVIRGLDERGLARSGYEDIGCRPEPVR